MLDLKKLQERHGFVKCFPNSYSANTDGFKIETMRIHLLIGTQLVTGLFMVVKDKDAIPLLSHGLLGVACVYAILIVWYFSRHTSFSSYVLVLLQPLGFSLVFLCSCETNNIEDHTPMQASIKQKVFLSKLT